MYAPDVLQACAPTLERFKAVSDELLLLANNKGVFEQVTLKVYTHTYIRTDMFK